MHNALTVAIALQHLAWLLALRGEKDDAARLTGYVNVQLGEIGYKRAGTEKLCYDKLMAVLAEKLRETEREKLEAEGAAWSEDQAVAGGLKV